MSIKQKLLTFPVVAILIFVIGMGITYRVSSKTSELVNLNKAVHYPFLQKTQALLYELKGIQVSLKNAVVTEDENDLIFAEQAGENFRTITSELEAVSGKAEVALTIQKQFNHYYKAASDSAALMIGIRSGDVTEAIQRMIPALKELEETLNQAGQRASGSFENSLSQIGRNVQSALWINFIMAVLTITFLSIVGYALAKMISGGISKGVELAQTVAQGDLRHQMEVDTSDEIGLLGQNLNQMAGNLKEMVNKISRSADDITAATKSIDTEKLGKGASTQAESVEGISVSINQMSESINKVADAAEILTDGANSNATAILEMTASIEEVATNANSLSNIIEDVSSSITEAVTSIKQVSGNVDVVSSSAEETSAVVHEFSASLKHVQENANEAALLSEKVKTDAAELGMTAIEKTIDGMNIIIKSVDTTDAATKRLGDKSAQISEILTVIGDVTDQTNLLSLNAAIIAAQAGEHGKGFAVVADGIRDLAERTSLSTDEIAAMISSIQNEVKEVVSSMNEVSDNAMKGMGLAKKAGGILSGIAETSNKSSQMAWQIEGATKEQAKGVDQVKESVVQITEMIRQIADAMKEQERANSNIVNATEEMKDIFSQVKRATVEQARGSKEITKNVESVNQEVQSIATATKDQRDGSEQIVVAVEQIEKITQQNLSLSSEVNKAIGTLTGQAELLQEEVNRFAV